MRRLAAALVQQTMDDALSERAGADEAYRVHPSDTCQREAIAFCVLATGSWAAARVNWCKLAGLDPEKVRQHVIATLKARRQAADGPPAATMEPDMARKKPVATATQKPVEPVAQVPAQQPAALIMITFQDGKPTCQWHNLHPLAVVGALDMMADEVKASLRNPLPLPAAA